MLNYRELESQIRSLRRRQGLTQEQLAEMWIGENESAKYWLGILNKLEKPGWRWYPDCLCGRVDQLCQCH